MHLALKGFAMNHIKIRWRCNLDDVMRREKWPEYLPQVPAVGDHIQSGTVYNGKWDGNEFFEGKRYLVLKVVRVTWEPKHTKDMGHEVIEWAPVVELHLPDHHFQNIIEFEKWYNSLR